MACASAAGCRPHRRAGLMRHFTRLCLLCHTDKPLRVLCGFCPISLYLLSLVSELHSDSQGELRKCPGTPVLRVPMVKVKVAVKSKECAARIRRTFQQAGDANMQLTASADKDSESVVVMDQDALDHLSAPLRNPGRVVLITHNDTELLARAWERGILSVVLESDSADTLLLAIESAALRIATYP